MRVYLAARYSKKKELREYAKQLRKAGITCTSSWLREKADDGTLSRFDDAYLTQCAERDFRDIYDSHTLVLFTVPETEPTRRGGRHVEFGMAYGLKLDVIICGPRENIFHYMRGIQQFDTFAICGQVSLYVS